MTWWCSAQGIAWTWSWRAYPGVWLVVSLIAISYIGLVLKLTPPDGVRRISPRHIRYFGLAMLVVWGATDWPLGTLGSGYLLFVHQFQYVLLVMVAPPLMLLGTPRWMCRALISHPMIRPIAAVVTRPVIAMVLCNAVVFLTHFPRVVDYLMPTQLGSFAVDMSWLVAGLALWWPAVQRVDQPNGLSFPARFGYLLAATLLLAIPAAFLFFANYPLYATYELAPPVGTMTATNDQFLGGVVMKLGSLAVVLFALTVIFFQWHAADRSPNGKMVLPRSVMDA